MKFAGYTKYYRELPKFQPKIENFIRILEFWKFSYDWFQEKSESRWFISEILWKLGRILWLHQNSSKILAWTLRSSINLVILENLRLNPRISISYWRIPQENTRILLGIQKNTLNRKVTAKILSEKPKIFQPSQKIQIQ